MTEPQTTSTGAIASSDALKTVYDFHQKIFWETTNLLAKSTAFYLAVTAGLTGYTLSQNLAPPFPRIALSIAVGATIVFWAVVTLVFWGLRGVIRRLEVVTGLLAPQVFESTAMGRFFARWRVMIWVANISMTAVGAMFLIGLIILIRSETK